MLATEANEICNKQNKKTITAPHIIESLRKLGYESYIEKAQEVLEEHKVEQEKTNKQTKKFNTSGLSQEELLKEQQRLFNQARTNQQIQSPQTMMMNSPQTNQAPSLNIFDQNEMNSTTNGDGNNGGSPFIFSSYQPPKVQLTSLNFEEEKKEEEKEDEE